MDTFVKRQPTTKNIFSYAVGDLFGGGAFFIIGALFLDYLQGVVLLSGTLAGLVIMIGKIWDAVSDPCMGYISDNTRSKHGRRRGYFLMGIVPIFISWVLLWTDFGLESNLAKFFYYLLVYMLFNTVFTLVMVPYNAMPAEMTDDFNSRSKLITIRMVFSQLGMLLGALLPMTIIKLFVDNPSFGYFVMAMVFGVIFSLPWIFVFKGTYEQEKELPKKQSKKAMEVIKGIGSDFLSTTKNKAMRLHTAMYIAAYVSMDIFNAFLIFFIRDYLKLFAYYQVLLGIVVIIQMSALFMVFKLVNKFGNATTYRIHATIWAVAVILLFLVEQQTPVYLVLAVGAIVGVGLSGCVMTPYNMLAFVVDSDEMITTKRREGIYAGLMTFLRKIAQAIALFLVGVSLDLIQYIKPINDVVQPQTTNTLMGIKYIFFLAPLVLLLFGIFTSFRFKLNPKNYTILKDEITRRKSGDNTPPISETKTVVESITGLPYDQLWSIKND
jgi:oligogalacturonide transporter